MTGNEIILFLLSVITGGVSVGVGLLIKMGSDVSVIKTTLAAHVVELEHIKEKIEKHESVFITEKFKTAQ